MRKFKAKKGSPLTNDQANAYGHRLIELVRELEKQSLQPEDIVQDAKNKDSVYHNWFEWNNKKAAHKHRKTQAQELLRSIVEVKIIPLKDKSQEVDVRIFHNVTQDDERGYYLLDYVLEHEDSHRQIIEKAKKEAREWSNRYKIYKELNKIHEAIAEVL